MKRLGLAPEKPPTIKKAFDHFVIHTGGRAVLDAMESCLGLSPAQVRIATLCLAWNMSGTTSTFEALN